MSPPDYGPKRRLSDVPAWVAFARWMFPVIAVLAVISTVLSAISGNWVQFVFSALITVSTSVLAWSYRRPRSTSG